MLSHDALYSDSASMGQAQEAFQVPESRDVERPTWVAQPRVETDGILGPHSTAQSTHRRTCLMLARSPLCCADSAGNVAMQNVHSVSLLVTQPGFSEGALTFLFVS